MASASTDIRQLDRYLREVLERDSRSVLTDVAAQLDSQEEPPWEILIPSERSLRFTSSTQDPRLSPDLFCKIRGPGVDEGVCEQNIVLRIWSNDPDICYRADWDSPKVKDQLTAQPPQERVIGRMHFDLAAPEAIAPRFHFQIGGNPTEGHRELCWHPQYVKIPRIPHQPMSLVLACELIVANFFPEKFSELRNTPEWKWIVIRSERQFILRYYRRCLDVLSKQESLLRDSILGSLWTASGSD